jgi:hypothetical protein
VLRRPIETTAFIVQVARLTRLGRQIAVRYDGEIKQNQLQFLQLTTIRTDRAIVQFG